MRKNAFSYAALLVAIVLIGVFLILSINSLKFIKDDHGNLINTRNGRFVNEFKRDNPTGVDKMLWENQDATPKAKHMIVGATCKEIFHSDPADPNDCNNTEQDFFNNIFDLEKPNGHADSVKLKLPVNGEFTQKIYRDGHFLVIEER